MWRADPVRVCAVLYITQRCGRLFLIRGSIAALITHGRSALAGLPFVIHELDSRPDNRTSTLLLYCDVVTHSHFRPVGSLIGPLSGMISEESCTTSRRKLRLRVLQTAQVLLSYLVPDDHHHLTRFPLLI